MFPCPALQRGLQENSSPKPINTRLLQISQRIFQSFLVMKHVSNRWSSIWFPTPSNMRPRVKLKLAEGYGPNKLLSVSAMKAPALKRMIFPISLIASIVQQKPSNIQRAPGLDFILLAQLWKLMGVVSGWTRNLILGRGFVSLSQGDSQTNPTGFDQPLRRKVTGW